MKKFLFFLLLALLIFPGFQADFQVIKSKPLDGFFQNTMPPEFSFPSWNKGDFQDQSMKHFDDSLGFKSDFVRLYNQIDFSLFDIVHAKKVTCGKDDYLFPVEYLNAYEGKDFAGKFAIDRHVRDLKIIQDFLWNQYKIFFLVILCPEKPAFYPEYLPARYHLSNKKMTNSRYLAQRCVEKGVHAIDFNLYFQALKDKSPYPLIPKTGVHWSYYGAYLAADSLAHYLKEKTGYPLPGIVLDSISKPGYPVAEDNDMGRTLNLIWDIPCPDLGYPKFHAVNEPGKPKPSALFVGDSFYWNWYYDGTIKSLFRNNDFWYYCKDVYSGDIQNPTSVSDINVEDVIKKQNFIILIQVNGAYGNPGYGFSELAMSALDPDHSILNKTEQAILKNPKLMEEITKKAKQNHLKFEDQLRLDAIWIIRHQRKESQPKN